LNIYAVNTPTVQQIYCRVTAWIWDLTIALLVFLYLTKCLILFFQYADKSKQVKNWNQNLKNKWKRYRLFFRARTQTISSFFTPRSSHEFLKGASIVKKLKLRRNSKQSLLDDSSKLETTTEGNATERESTAQSSSMIMSPYMN
jgi:hypothetical protein